MGDLVEAEGIVRTGLAATGHRHAGGDSSGSRRGCWRCVGAQNDTAREPPDRARTSSCLISRRAQSREAGAPIAEILLAQNDPAAAFEFIERVLPLNAVDPRVVDELMVLGARAAADLVQQASDERDQAAVRRHREALTRLVKTRATLPGVAFQPSGPEDTVQVARAALFAAEAGRAEGVEDQISPVEGGGGGVCHGRSRLGSSRSASWRLAAALVESGAPGTEAAELLRERPRLRHPAGRRPARRPGRGACRERTHLADHATSAPLSMPYPPRSPG